ncbi:MAG: 30S ribosomal protein S9 [Candidatus Andersenbacteria bacterium]
MPTKARKSAAKPRVRKTVRKVTTRSHNVQGYYGAVGRRKTSVVRARLTPGKGSVTVNGKTMQQYFPDTFWQASVVSPLILVGQRKSVDISILAHGGGVNSQAEAARLAISRALEKMDPTFRGSLKKAGYLRRDPREKERKKYGLKRARRAPQFSKR